MKFQYIGFGDDPPEKINFMGQVKFALKGKFVEVTDKALLAKLENHQCFKAKAK